MLLHEFHSHTFIGTTEMCLYTFCILVSETYKFEHATYIYAYFLLQQTISFPSRHFQSFRSYISNTIAQKLSVSL